MLDCISKLTVQPGSLDAIVLEGSVLQYDLDTNNIFFFFLPRLAAYLALHTVDLDAGKAVNAFVFLVDMREVSVSLLICLHSYRTFYITGIAGAGIDSLRKRSRRQSTSRPHHTIPKTPILLPRSPTRSPLNVPNLVEPSTPGLLQQQKDTRFECATKMAPSPLLPQLPADDSMLTRRFGAETANYFSGVS